MLYVPTTNKEHIPLGWEEAEYLFKKLQILCLGTTTRYQFVWERRMFLNSTYPEFRVQLVKWVTSPRAEKPKREVLAEAYSCAEIAPVLLMLVAVATDERKRLGLPDITGKVTWD
jgi:hypothetical protein